MKSLLFSLFLMLAVASAHAGDSVSSLNRRTRDFLDAFSRLRPGLTEKEIRALYPDLGDVIESDDQFGVKCGVAATPGVLFAQQEWSLQFYFVDGKLRGARLGSIQNADETLRITRADARILKRTIMRHFADQYGPRPELEVPMLECPAGNPYGLRKSWSLRTHILAVDYDGASNTGSVTVIVWEPKAWEEGHKKEYEEYWPFKPA